MIFSLLNKREVRVGWVVWCGVLCCAPSTHTIQMFAAVAGRSSAYGINFEQGIFERVSKCAARRTYYYCLYEMQGRRVLLSDNSEMKTFFSLSFIWEKLSGGKNNTSARFFFMFK